MSISKTGILSSQLIEPYLTLADGSNWQLLLFHYVDGGNNLFTPANCEYCNEPGLFSRLQWIDNFQYNGLYEFYVIQDGVEHRWSQTSAPWTSTSITGFTAISGTPVVGICKRASDRAALAETSTGNWWNSCGTYLAYTYGGKTGIPGFGANSNTHGTVCTNYLALYARINKPIAFLENNIIQTYELYEY